VPIIFVTGFEQSTSQMFEGYALGAVDFLFKPIIPQVLRAKVAVFIALEERTAEVLRQAEMLRQAERARWEADLLQKQAAEQRRLANDLVALNAKLKDADRRKDEFLAMLAHELRNPLAPLHTSLELLRLDGADVPRLRAMMHRQVVLLTRLVDDLLDVSRVISGKVALHLEHVDLRMVIDQVLATTHGLIEEHGHEVAVVLPNEPFWVTVDPVRFAQIVSNLLSNAARHTPRHGRIELRCEQAGDEVVVRVIDEGPGIPHQEREQLFEPFVQRRIGSGGLGVGLTLVRRLAELHGGTVTNPAGPCSSCASPCRRQKPGTRARPMPAPRAQGGACAWCSSRTASTSATLSASS
jgi:signal transduction histidine kinase